MTKKMAAGGKASSFRDMTAGSGSGLGRLQKTSIAAKTKTQKLKVGGMVKGYADGGPMTMDEIIAANMKRNPGFKMAPGYEASARMGMEKQASDTSPERAAYNARQAKRESGAVAARKKVNARANKNDRADLDAKTMERGIRKIEGNMAERDAAYNSMKDDAFRAMLKGKQRTSAIGGGMSEDPVYPMTSEEMRDAASKMNATVGGMRRGGMAKMAKGGKVKNFEGSFMDMVQDRKLAKKYGMSKKDYEKSSIDAKHDKQQNMKGLKMGGMTKMAAGGMSTAQDGMKGALRPKPTAMAMGGYAKGGKSEMHDKGCKCMPCGGKVKMAKGGKVTFGSMKPLPGTKTVGPTIRPTVETGASMKKDGMKGQLRAKASGAKPTNMMKPLGMTKMASGGKVRGTGIAQRGTKFIGEV
jgi:hypothetical protein